MREDIIITDLTRMWRDRICIAGYDQNDVCVRPINPHGHLMKGWLSEMGVIIIRPFNIVEFDFSEDVDYSPPHTEDRKLLNLYHLPKGRIEKNRQESFLNKIDDKCIDSIFGAELHRDIGCYVRAGEGSRSLGTICYPKILGIEYGLSLWNNKWDYRIEFKDQNSDHYNLPVVDMTFRYYLDWLQFRNGFSSNDASRRLEVDLTSSALPN